MICSNCSEPIPKDAVVIGGPDGEKLCPKCSGFPGSTLGKQKDIDGPTMSSREEIEFSRDLFEGAGQLKGQKIERAQIVEHLRMLAAQMRAVLPNSNDAIILSDVSFMLERREHWAPPKDESDGE